MSYDVEFGGIRFLSFEVPSFPAISEAFGPSGSFAAPEGKLLNKFFPEEEKVIWKRLDSVR